MIKYCVVCGQAYETARRDRKTCGDPECRAIQKREYLRIYAQKRRKYDREAVNEYNRIWMYNYRHRTTEEKPEIVYNADTYAERQKARTLAMVGSIQT